MLFCWWGWDQYLITTKDMDVFTIAYTLINVRYLLYICTKIGDISIHFCFFS